MTAEYQCGNVTRVPVGTIADRAARRILEYSKARALTMDPEGRVWVESPRVAAEADLVGVYTRDAGLIDLSIRIASDLRHEKEQRGLIVRPKRRVVSRPHRREAA